jgi:hypothetical protein
MSWTISAPFMFFYSYSILYLLFKAELQSIYGVYFLIPFFNNTECIVQHKVQYVQ